jgi:hypothetical protein
VRELRDSLFFPHPPGLTETKPPEQFEVYCRREVHNFVLFKSLMGINGSFISFLISTRQLAINNGKGRGIPHAKGNRQQDEIQRSAETAVVLPDVSEAVP